MTGWKAVADLGTHSCLLLVGRAGADGGLEVCLDRCEVPRMGEGLDRTGRISDAALERVEGVLRGYLREARERGCAEVVVGGTAALRRAQNTDAVMQRLAGIEEPGVRIAVELIGEADEARYGWMAAAGGNAATCVLDVGGGSTEVVVGGTAALRRAQNTEAVMQRLARIEEPGVRIAVELIGEADEARYGWMAAAGGDAATCVLDVGGGSTEVVAATGTLMRSAPLGAVVLTERVGRLGWDALLGEARSELACLAEGAERLDSSAPWVALGGTPSNLASLELGLGAFDHLAVEGAVLDAGAAARWGQALAGMELEERLELPIEAARAEVLPAGLACMAAGLEAFWVHDFRVTGRGLRYGFLAALLART